MASEDPFGGTAIEGGTALERLLGFRVAPLRPLAETLAIPPRETASMVPSELRCPPEPLLEPAPCEARSLWGRIWGGVLPGPVRALRVALDATVVDRGVAGNTVGRALDVSVTGMMLRSETPYALGDGLAIRFRLPGSARDVRCGAMVVRVSDGDAAGEYGLRFTALPAADRAEIEEFLARSAPRVTLAVVPPHAA